MRSVTAIGAALLAIALGASALGASVLGASPGHAREAGDAPGVQSQQLLEEDFVGEPGKEAVSHVYSFPSGAVLPWHLHADAHEVVYVLEGDFTMEVAGEGEKHYKAGDSFYLAPNRIHRGKNQGSGQVRLFVVRIKPKDKPLATEVPPPN